MAYDDYGTSHVGIRRDGDLWFTFMRTADGYDPQIGPPHHRLRDAIEYAEYRERTTMGHAPGFTCDLHGPIPEEPAAPGLPEGKEAYVGLANELTATDADGSPITYRDEDWDDVYVVAAKEYAKQNHLPYPPLPASTGWLVYIQSYVLGKETK